MKKYSIGIAFCLLAFLPFFSLAQKSMNADSLYFVARQYAIDGQYNEAIQLSEKILAQYPSYWDVRILMARTYAWQRQFEPAVANVSEVLAKDPKNYDAYSALIDFYFWKGDNQSSIATIDQALMYFPDDALLLIKKAKVQMAISNLREARKTIDQIEEIDHRNESLPLLKKGAGHSHSNILRMEHYYDTFSNPYDRKWHMSSVGYGRRTSVGDYYAKVYLGDLIGDGESLYSGGVGKQFAIECYPKIDENNSMFVNYSWSPDAVFPNHRVGLEYYHVFQSKIELSGGYRYLNFSEGLTEPMNVQIATGSIGWYFSKYWLSFRPYFVFRDLGNSSVYMLTGRYYLPREESYLGLNLGAGISPDSPYFYTEGESIPDLKSWRVELEWKQKISNWLLFELQGGYENGEFSQGVTQDKYSARTSISILF
ncbi:YaiO family outer membrane beta-barrel protein [Mangrovibacterium sp.]|uniref:YaiO family outer membrane beta-barrel protein n=1 Tax=Mangrovibacterium sp. TaxID=1961364 RepID=UPI0035650929